MGGDAYQGNLQLLQPTEFSRFWLEFSAVSEYFLTLFFILFDLIYLVLVYIWQLTSTDR
jgi:hypothetical protein